jgi:ATP-dependent RNA helicase RhlE
MEFSELKITREFLNALEDAGFGEPTPVQKKAIPRVRSGRDLIGIAQTGTGKTAAYLLPLLQEIKFAQGNDPRCLILVPTKELVLQVNDHVEMLSSYTDIRSVAIYGGIGPKGQLEQLAKGTDIVVATPGRFMDIYLKGGVVTKQIRFVVLDEADRMLDMGFMHQVRKIQEVIPRKRQNLLFSATFPEKVERFADEFLDFPDRIEVSPPSTPVETVAQKLYEVPNIKSKLNLLLHLLQDEETFTRVLVFTQTKGLAQNTGKFLERKIEGGARIIHSNKGQNSRINALNEFRRGEVRVLVSTDVAARGIDVQNVSHVINLSVPRDYQDYIHRIGRTGRALQAGTAITFADMAEMWHIEKIEDLIKQEIERLEVPEEVEMIHTPRGERQDQLREIDHLRRREDPTFKGAFHEKKGKIAAREKQQKSKGKPRSGKMQ